MQVQKTYQTLFVPVRAPQMSRDARRLQNVIGPDTEMLRQFILSKLPTIEYGHEGNVSIHYGLAFTERDEESPASYPKLYALIRGTCQGAVGRGRQPLEGIWEARVVGDARATTVTCRNLYNGLKFDATYEALPSIEQVYSLAPAAA